MQQNIFLFSESIIDNIRLGNEDISRQDAIAAAKEVHLHTFVQKMSEGYDTEVREDGSGLSEG